MSFQLITEADVRVALGLESSYSEAERALVQQVIAPSIQAVVDHIGYDPVQSESVEFYPRGDFSPRAPTAVSYDVDEAGTVAVPMAAGGVGSSLQLARVPVRRIASLRIDHDGRFGSNPTAFGADKELPSSDYWLELEQADLCRSGLVLSRSRFPSEPGTIRVQFVAGYSRRELAGVARETMEEVIDGVTEYTSAGVNASPLVRAARMTAVRAFLAQHARRKSVLVGFAAAGALTSEKLGDYAYTRDAAAAAAMVGESISLSGEAMDLLEPFVHYGQARL